MFQSLLRQLLLSRAVFIFFACFVLPFINILIYEHLRFIYNFHGYLTSLDFFISLIYTTKRWQCFIKYSFHIGLSIYCHDSQNLLGTIFIFQE